MTKHIIRKLIIDEISAVDRPAQEHALAVIMKRDERNTTMDLQNVDLQALAHEICLLKAAELRKKDPSSRSSKPTRKSTAKRSTFAKPTAPARR